MSRHDDIEHRSGTPGRRPRPTPVVGLVVAALAVLVVLDALSFVLNLAHRALVLTVLALVVIGVVRGSRGRNS
jgi:hypothetical protein